MATVTGFTAARMKAIEDGTVVGGSITGDNLTLIRHDGGAIVAGNVRGATGSPGVTSGELATSLANSMPVGSVIDYMGAAAPNANWLLMTGQTIANAQTLYPAWWAQIPASMKSGSSAIMPDTRGKVSVGLNTSDTDFDVIGEVGGAKTVTLAQAHLPAVALPCLMPDFNIVAYPPATSVLVDPPATVVLGSTGGASDIFPNDASGWYLHYSPALVQSGGSGAVGVYNYDDGNSFSMPHNHPAGGLYIDMASFYITVNMSSFNITAVVPDFNTGNMGSGTAHSNVQPYVVFMKIVKVL